MKVSAAASWIAACLVPATAAFRPLPQYISTTTALYSSSSKEQKQQLISYDDPTRLFHTDENGGYIPAGLTAEEWAALQQKEADQQAQMQYGAWGPRFKQVQDPVANDMAWMCMPNLWTGEDDAIVEVVQGEETDVTMPITSDFLKDTKPWGHAQEVEVSVEGEELYRRFAEREESVQEMVQKSFTTRQKMDGKMTNEAIVLRTCEYVGHILRGIARHGNQHDIDLTRLAIHCAPDLSDWDGMYQAEYDILKFDVTAKPDDNAEGLLLCGKVSREDFLRAILKVRFPSEEDEEEDDEDEESEDPLKQFSEADLAEMYLCLDWYIALRRVGIMNPFSAVFADGDNDEVDEEE